MKFIISSCFLFLALSCSETSPLSDRKPQSTVDQLPTIHNEIGLSKELQESCSTKLDTISRFQAAEKSFLRAIFNQAAHRLDCIEALSQAIEQYFLNLSAEISTQLGTLALNYDVVIIGAGPQGAILALNLMRLGKLKVLIVEKNPSFALHFKSTIYPLQFPEARDESTLHPFPNAPTQITDIMSWDTASPRDYQIPLAFELWEQVAFTLFASNAEYLHDKIVNIKHAVAFKTSDSYQLEFASGKSITARSVVFATGLGEPTADLDTSSLELINSTKNLSSSASLPLGLYVDEFIQWAENKRKTNASALAIFRGKTVAIIGGHAGGLLLKNFLTGEGPKRAYDNEDKRNLPQEIYWFGSKAPTVGNVQSIPSRVNSIRLVKKNNREMIEIVASDGGPNRYADYVIVAGGYKNTLKSVLAGLENRTSIFSLMRPIMQPTSDANHSEVVAKQLYLSNKPQKIFFIGAAKGEKEKTAILTDAPKTEAFAKVLAEELLPTQN